MHTHTTVPTTTLRGVVAVVPVVLTLASCSSDDGDGGNREAASSRNEVTVTVTEGAADTVQAQAPDPCDPTVLGTASPDGWDTLYCDRGWARVALAQSDGMALLRWSGETWQTVEPAGETFTGFRCYDRAALTDEGAPAEVFGNITVC